MPPYPVTYGAVYEEERSRLHTFFRFLTVIPVGFVIWLFALAMIVTLPIAWVAILITGRYPPMLYLFHSGVVRNLTRVSAYAALVTDRYPPFHLDDDPDYPVRVTIGPPLPHYDRLLTAVRLFLYIPVAVVSYALMLIAELAAIGAWFVIVVTGRQMPVLQSAINMGHAYQTRAWAYATLVTEHWPPFEAIGFELEPVAPETGELNAPSPPPAPPAPVS